MGILLSTSTLSFDHQITLYFLFIVNQMKDDFLLSGFKARSNKMISSGSNTAESKLFRVAFGQEIRFSLNATYSFGC